MTILRNIVVQKITSCVLLALLLVIHAIKFFHHHTNVPLQPGKLQMHIILPLQSGFNAQHCSICDFQLTGSIDVQIPNVAEPPVLPRTAICSCYYNLYHSRIAAVLHLRGPPVVA